MTKEHAQGVFIRFIDFRGELLLRASAIDGVVPSEKNAATYVYLNGTRLTVELPGNDSNLLIVFYVQIMPDDFVMQLHRF